MRLVPRALVLSGIMAACLGLPVAANAAITGTVYMDYNSNGANNAGGFVSGSSVTATDVGVAGVTVNAYDASGTRVSTTTTAAGGTYTVCASGCTGTVRLEFSVPSGYQPSFTGTNNGTSVRFVSATATNVDFALTKPTQYCQDNPRLVTCMFPIADSQTQVPREFGGFSFPASLSGSTPLVLTDAGKTDDTNGSYATPTTVAGGRAIGATFGVGVDRSRNVFFGSYVKRHSEYALDSSGNPRTGLNIYRVNLADSSVAATLTPWVTFTSPAVLPEHSAENPAFVAPGTANDFPYAADGNRSVASGQTGYSSVYENVGRAGLGDVDVSPDGSKLYAVEMTEGNQGTAAPATWPRLWHVPINADGTAGTPVGTDLTKPSTFNDVACWGKWHPMGIGVRDDEVLIGGVCGGEGKLEPLPLRPTGVSVASRVVTVTTATGHGLDVGDFVQLANVYTNANGVQQVSATTPTTFTYTKSGGTAPTDTAGVTPGATASVTPDIPGGTFTSRSRASGIATITTTAAHDLSVGDWVTVSGAGGSGYNGLVRLTAITGTTFSYASTGLDESSVSLTAGYAKRESAPVAAFIQRRNGSGGFDTIAAFSLGYPKSITNGNVTQLSAGTGFEWQLGTKPYSGVWRTWSDVPPPANYATDLSSANPFQGSSLLSSGSDAGSFGQPMLANIEIMDDGSLVVALRDRYMDQVSPSDTLNYERGSETLLRSGQGSAEIIKVCKSGSSYSLETAGACGSDAGAGASNGTPIITGSGMTSAMRDSSALFYWNAFFGTSVAGSLYGNDAYITHAYTGLGGTASLPGSKTIWSTSYDINAANQQGVKVFGPCAARSGSGSCGPAGRADGAIIGGAGFRYSLASEGSNADRYSFRKGNGLGDLELVCDAAPVQIGNYVWIDANRNGIQDPDETRVQGVTVRLYDATNTLVGTAVTDANGQYYFSSNVTEAAAGNGDNSGGGLTTGQAFTVRLDNPADYAVGGPLVPYTLTSATQTSPGTGSTSTSVDSNATLVADYPRIAVAALSAGQNNHTYDVGFVTPLAANPVAVGNYTWIDANGNGVQDGGESPLAGVVVALLNPDGTPANDINGAPVATQTTDAQGSYLFDNLAPGTYKVQFTLPAGYTFTSTGGGTSATDSNPSAGVDPLVGTTPVFAVSALITGDTVADSDSATTALRVNPTIDAGVVVAGGSGGGGSGGGGSGGGGSGGSGGSGSGGGSGTGDGGAGAGGASGSGSGSGSSAGAASNAERTDLTGRGPNGTNTNGVSGGPGSSNPVPGANSGALVGVGDLVWFDTDRDGVQDPGERPMRGTRVTLLNADGTRARNADGKVIPAQTTDARGRYFFANLQPGRYAMRFTFPSGAYVPTEPGQGSKSKGSNANPTRKANVAQTGVFVVAGIAYGETDRDAAQGQPKAALANPSIDAGVIPPWALPAATPSTVTG